MADDILYCLKYYIIGTSIFLVSPYYITKNKEVKLIKPLKYLSGIIYFLSACFTLYTKISKEKIDVDSDLNPYQIVALVRLTFVYIYVSVYFIQIYRNHEKVLKVITMLQTIDQNLKLQNKEYRRIRFVMIFCLIVLYVVFSIYLTIAKDKSKTNIFYNVISTFFALVLLQVPSVSEFYILIFVSIIQMYIKRLHIEMNNVRTNAKADLQNK